MRNAQTILTRITITSAVIILLLVFFSFDAISQCAKFEPPDGNALLVIGQDMNAIGGSPEIGYSNGYMDKVGGPVPGGFTQYTSMNYLEGLTSLTQMCTGHDYQQHLAQKYTNNALVVGLYCVGMTSGIAAGNYDNNIHTLAAFYKTLAPKPIFLRIAFEFDYQYSGEQATYVTAWKRIVNIFRQDGVTNVAYVWQAAAGNFSSWSQCSAWYPGDDYVDWFAYSQWATGVIGKFMIEEAGRRNKPCMIAESAYQNQTITSTTNSDWENWFQNVINLFATYPQLKAWCLINSDWEALGCWGGWGDQRIQNNDYIKTKWLAEINKPFWLKASPTLFTVLNNCGAKIPLTVDAGQDVTVKLPITSTTLTGTASGGTGTYTYSWTKVSGPAATLANAATSVLGLSNMVEGAYVFRLTVNDADTSVSNDITVTVTSLKTTPWGGTPATIPGKIEAENYDMDGAEISYHDSTPGNEGKVYRSDDVDIGVDNTGYVVAWTTPGEWLDYTVNVKETGIYTFSFPVSTTNTGKTFHIELDGNNITGTVQIPSTGSWNTYQAVSVNNISLTAGNYKVMRIYPDGFNIDYITAALDQATSINTNNEELSMDIYPNPAQGEINISCKPQAASCKLMITNVMGQVVLDLPFTAYRLPLTIDISALQPGVYFVRIVSGDHILVKKLVKE